MGDVALAERQAGAHLEVLGGIGARDITADQTNRAMFAPQNLNEAMRLADLMAAGNFVPKHLRGKPGDCLAVIMQAARWGMDSFAVGNKTYFVNDRMAYEAQLVNAVVNSSGQLEGRLQVSWEGRGEALVCTVVGRIKGDPDPKTRRVEIKNLTVRNSPLWKQDPEQQLAYYATRAWARLYTPETLMGVYTPDEAAEMPPVDGGTVQSSRVSIADLREQAKPADTADEELTKDAEFLRTDLKGDGAPADTATDDNPTAAEGRSDDQHGDQHDGTDQAAEEDASPAEREMRKQIGMCERATTDDHIAAVQTRFAKHESAFDTDQIKRLSAALNAAKERISQTK